MTALQAARRLMKRYAPHVTLRLLKRPPYYRAALWQEPDGALSIRWCPSTPLTLLLHEIGHLRLRHYGGQAYTKACVSKAELVLHEVGAWLWAEHAAWKHRLPFAYELADAYLGSYCSRVRVAWRHRKRLEAIQAVSGT